jgi:hypothetical protein
MAKRKTTEIPKHIVSALKQVWPDGVVDMPLDPDTSYFWDEYEKLRHDLSHLNGRVLLYERKAEGGPQWAEGSDPDKDLPDWDKEPRSYHLFFISPADNAVHYETEGQEPDENDVLHLVTGEGSLGCAVGVSLLAPFAVVVLDGMEESESGSRHDPDIEPHIIVNVAEKTRVDESGEGYCKDTVGEEGLCALVELRARISRVLESHHIEVLREDVLRQPIPWLRGGEEALVGQAGEPVTVRTALFFHGL